MPILRMDMRPARLSRLDESIPKMSMKELIAYEEYLWVWMDKAHSPTNIARILNSIHREVEWRAQDT